MKKLILSVLFSMCLSSLALAQPTNSPFGPVPADNTPYDATAWDGSWSPPTQNAVRDQIEAMIAVPTFSGDILPDTDNAYDIGEDTTPLRFRNMYLSGTIDSTIGTIDQVITPLIQAPAASLAIKPTTDAVDAVQIQDKDGNAIVTVDTTNDRVGIGTSAPTTTFAVAGGQSVKKTNVSDANYGTSDLTSDYIIAFTSLMAARTATISTEDVESGTATQPRVMKFKDQSGNAGSYPITIVLENSGTIDGQAAYSINQAYGAVEIWLDGSNGFVAP